MKKIITILLLAIMSLSAGTVGEGAKDPRHFGKLFFDYNIAGANYYEYVESGNRKVMAIDNRVIGHLKTAPSSFNYTIKGRINYPEYMEGNQAIIQTPTYHIRIGGNNQVKGVVYLNGKEAVAQTTPVKVKTDSAGNKYIDFELKGHAQAGYIQQFVKGLSSVNLDIAPAKKKRGEPFAWEKAKFYVIEE